MASTANFQVSVTSLLTGAVSGTSGGLIQTDGTFRRYRSGLSIGVQEHGVLNYSRRSIFYEVGRRYGRLTDALAYQKGDDEGLPLIDASVPINPAQAANFEGWARKYSNFSPQWATMDLAGLAERLAKGVAAQSVYGGVTTTNLRGGQPVRVVALGTLDSPQTASTNSIFIPRTVDTTTSDNTFAVLAAAANGEGATVTTDVVRLDAATNQPVIPAVDGYAFATACVEALRIVGANLEESGAGDVFAYAVARGIHAIVSVVAHTDEGGWMRNAFRSCTFRVPYGGINSALSQYPQLPPLAGSSAASVSSWVDAVALKTAAAVAHCDPCVTATGGLYPTVFTSSSGQVGAAGTAGDDPTNADAQDVARQLAADFGRFAPTYITALRRIFGLTSDSGVAAMCFSTAARQALFGPPDRHLKYKTVAPYFWIEPTSLIPASAFGTTAESAGFGALTTAGIETTIPCFERVRELDHGRNANFSTIAFKMRTARTSGLVAAYAGAPAALAGLKLYQFDEDSVALAGDQGPTPGDVPMKHSQADPLSSYLWTRGQSPIPAPAEFINIQGAYAAKYKIVDWDDDFNGRLGDLPEAFELENYGIRWRVTVPTALPSGASNAGDTGAKRARTRAAIALAQANIRNRGFGEANSPVISVSNVPPSFDDTPPPMMAAASGAVHDAANRTIPEYAEGAATAGAPPVMGAPLGPIPHHQPLRGAPYPRQGGGQVGGAGLPPNPPLPGNNPPPPPPTGPSNPPTNPDLDYQPDPAGPEAAHAPPAGQV
ncbi:coat protein [Nigrospora oryzae victorivirus 1]|uniref:Coat protein n=1 Tax=Nigrospora oryzae victorivirus 1 TaxID=1765736 RepID=A0A0S3IRN1_9VIRU|nr:coat protein [Nigrospora oryzae victorivirus 1]ALR68224.1 coat protein [Nigrospora oryzae victorivirus 1]